MLLSHVYILDENNSIESNIFVWDYFSKIVVSDVDGTITKSDVRGQILPNIGIDWTHDGIAELYSLIYKNGYKIIYLSARALIQVPITKSYLKSINQGEL